jgi:REP element-mobilizing transposase RayT
MARPPRIPVWLEWDQPVIYFLTFCVANRHKVLANDRAFVAFKSAIARLTKWDVIAAILMPDHVHLLIAPLEREAAVGNASAALKRFIRQDLKATWQWQPGSFDRLLRSDESAEHSRESGASRFGERMERLALLYRFRIVGRALHLPNRGQRPAPSRRGVWPKS